MTVVLSVDRVGPDGPSPSVTRPSPIGDDVPLGRIHQWNIGMKMS